MSWLYVILDPIASDQSASPISEYLPPNPSAGKNIAGSISQALRKSVWLADSPTPIHPLPVYVLAILETSYNSMEVGDFSVLTVERQHSPRKPVGHPNTLGAVCVDAIPGKQVQISRHVMNRPECDRGGSEEWTTRGGILQPCPVAVPSPAVPAMTLVQQLRVRRLGQAL